MVELTPMSAEEFDAYLDKAVADYAAEHVRAGHWDPSEAPERARREFEQLLPQGPASPDQYLFSVLDETSGAKVGMIWFALMDRDRPKPMAFIYDFLIFDAYRRMGYGRQVMLAIEEKVRALRVNSIGLHVFAHNHAARALYEQVGYTTSDLWMSKELE